MTEHHEISYQVSFSNPGTHVFEVCCTIPDPDPDGQCFSLPAWIPGSYLIRDFARHVVDIHAKGSSGQHVEIVKIDKQTWQAEPVSGSLTVLAEIFAFDPSVRGAHLDHTHAFFNGTSLFLRVHGRDRRACRVRLCAPENITGNGWHVATAMAPETTDAQGFGWYRAENYEALIDHPVEIAPQTVVEFSACGVPHRMAIRGRHQADTERLAGDLKRICEHHIRFFGEPAPIENYVFLLNAVGKGYGGLEHRASTALISRRDALPTPAQNGVSEDYREFLALCSHEYFHTWNVKRIRPEVFNPPDLHREVHTRLWWVFEGMTSYYDELSLVRCGLINRESYLEMLARTITRVHRTSGRLRQSVAESSFDAWTKFYKQDENSPNAIVSYYSKGALVALLLDLELRRNAISPMSLDTVMRALWQRYGLTGRGVPENGIEDLLRDLGAPDLDDFFARYVYGTAELPLAEALAHVGVTLEWTVPKNEKDVGGYGAPKSNGAGSRAEWGMRTEATEGGLRLRHVDRGGAAEQAGLAPGDVVIAVDGLRIDSAGLERLMARTGPETTLRVHAFRGDELFDCDVVTQPPRATSCWLRCVPDAGPDVQSARDAWLAGRDPSR